MGRQLLNKKGIKMEFALAGIVSLFIGIYLVITIIYPEKF
jgi:hypothetical protein